MGTDKVNLSQIPFRELEAMFVCFFSLTKKNVILDTYLTNLKTGSCKGIIARRIASLTKLEDKIHKAIDKAKDRKQRNQLKTKLCP